MRRIISLLLENESGALSRVIGLFAQRGYNIETLARLTLTTVATDEQSEQITKQLNKLIEVIKLVDLTEGEYVERELMLIKLRASGLDQAEIKRTTDIFRGQIVDISPTTYTVQLIGTSKKLDAFIHALAEFTVIEVVRSGVSGLSRGEKVLSV